MQGLTGRVANDLPNVDSTMDLTGDYSANEPQEAMTPGWVLSVLLACHDTQTLLDNLADAIVEKTSADAAYIAKARDAGDYLEFVALSGVHAEHHRGTFRRRGDGLFGQVWESGESLFIEDLSKASAVSSWQPGTQAYAIPLIVDDKTVAVLAIMSGPDVPDLSNEIPLLRQISAVATLAISNTLLIDKTQATLAITRALGEVGRVLNTVDNTSDACEAVSKLVLPALEAFRVSRYTFDSAGALRADITWSLSDGQIQKAPVFSTGSDFRNVAHWCVENNTSALVGRDDTDLREAAGSDERRRELNIGSTFCVPLRQDGEAIGAMTMSRSLDQRDFDPSETEIFTSIVDQLSIAFERLKLADELQHQAYHDRLTNLPNRHLFETRLQTSISEAQSTQSILVVLFIDLDGFKAVNDTLGHAAGDGLLIQVAENFRGVVSQRDTLARMGGDEFAVIVRSEDSVEGATLIAKRLLDTLSKPIDLDGQSVSVGASIGLGQYPAHGDTREALLRSADTAMYHAKKCGKGQIFCFDDSLAQDARDARVLEQEMQTAIEEDQFHLVYQPQVRCSDNKVTGVEALIRWQHPERGLLLPAEFVPLAQSTGWIAAISDCAIQQAIEQLAQWRGTALGELRISVNIAAGQLQVADFCQQILDALQRHDVRPELLELEVTESAVLNDLATVIQRLGQLRAAGIRVAVDDFGTGYSSLTYLQDLPINVLKIDRSFTSQLPRQHDRQSLVKTIQLLASGLGLETVVEGVETAEQKQAVHRLGCDLIQGNLLAAPLPAEQIPATISAIHGGSGDTSQISLAA